MKIFNGPSVTGSKGSCLLCWMFGNSLENLGKSTGECKNKHSDRFPKFLKIFGKNRKMLQSAQDDLSLWMSSEICLQVLKIAFQHFWNFFEIFRNCRKCSEIFLSVRKKSENVGKFSKRSSYTFWKFSKIFGNLRRCLEMLGKLRKPSEIFQM